MNAHSIRSRNCKKKVVAESALINIAAEHPVRILHKLNYENSMYYIFFLINYVHRVLILRR